MTRLNMYADEPWDIKAEKMRIRTRFFGLPLGAKELGASVHELLHRRDVRRSARK